MTFIMALLGGSVGAAVVTAFFQIWSSMRKSELQIVQNQLRGLYGPLYYFTCLNKALFDLYNYYHAAYDKEYIGKNIALEAKEDFQKEAVAMLEEGNSYINTEVMQNNTKIIALLEKNLIDPDDVEIFSQFQIDMARLKRTGNQTIRTAFSLEEHIGSVSFMRPKMIDRVKEKWDLKRERMDQLAKMLRL
jgi:hypothetical protein